MNRKYIGEGEYLFSNERNERGGRWDVFILYFLFEMNLEMSPVVIQGVKINAESATTQTTAVEC